MREAIEAWTAWMRHAGLGIEALLPQIPRAVGEPIPELPQIVHAYEFPWSSQHLVPRKMLDAGPVLLVCPGGENGESEISPPGNPELLDVESTVTPMALYVMAPKQVDNLVTARREAALIMRAVERNHATFWETATDAERTVRDVLCASCLRTVLRSLPHEKGDDIAIAAFGSLMRITDRWAQLIT